MRTILLLPLFGLAFAACSTTTQEKAVDETKEAWLDPNPILATEIESRIESIPYRHGEELVNHLMWIVERGEVAAGQTLDGLYHEDPKVRSNCAWILGQMGQRGVLSQGHLIMPHLETLLTDEHEAVRLEAATSLIALGDFAAAPVLIEGMDSESPRARFLCSKTLERATNREVEFDHLASDPAERAESIAVWRRWWAKQSNDPFFHDNYAKTYGLPTLAEQEASNQAVPTVNPTDLPAAPIGDVMPQVNTGDNTETTGNEPETTGEDPTGSTGETGATTGTPETGSTETSATGTETGTNTTGTTTTESTTGTPTAGTETGTAGTQTGTEQPKTGEKPASPFEWLRRKN